MKSEVGDWLGLNILYYCLLCRVSGTMNELFDTDFVSSSIRSRFAPKMHIQDSSFSTL